MNLFYTREKGVLLFRGVENEAAGGNWKISRETESGEREREIEGERW